MKEEENVDLNAPEKRKHNVVQTVPRTSAGNAPSAYGP